VGEKFTDVMENISVRFSFVFPPHIRPLCLQVSTYKNMYKRISAFQFMNQFSPTCTPSQTFVECADHSDLERSAQKQQHHCKLSLFS
jgi:hypothetical protein